MIRALRQLVLLTTSATTVALVTVAAPATAQKTDLGLSGGTITFPAPTATDYINGFVNSTSGVTYTLDATNGNQSHTTTVLIRTTSANLGSGKSLGDLQWRRSDLSAWNSIATTDAQVEQKIMIRSTLNDPWSNTIFFRMVLDWTKDAPATYSANYQITLSQTVP
jgi:hypothetical protein